MIGPTTIAATSGGLTRAEAGLLAPIEARAEVLLATLIDWAEVNSGSRNAAGLDAMRARIEAAFASLGGKIEAAPLAPAERVTNDGRIEAVQFTPAFRLIQRPEAPVQLVLTGHHDTVYGPEHSLQRCTRRDADTLNGPGVADMKGGLLVMAEALAALERSPDRDRVGYTVLISPDEEIGSPGSGPLLAELGARAHAGLTFEPALADGRLAGARKGSGNFSLIVTGRSAHAGRDHASGRSAVLEAARLVVALEALNGRREGVTVNVGSIDGGGPVNVVPANAVVRFNVRVPDAAAAAWTESQLADLVAAGGRHDGITVRLHGGFTRPPKPLAPANAAVMDWVLHAGGDLGLALAHSPSGGVCEGNNLWAAGCPNVDTLGPRGANIHSAEETVSISSLVERAKLAGLVLLRIASGAYDARAARALVAEGRA